MMTWLWVVAIGAGTLLVLFLLTLAWPLIVPRRCSCCSSYRWRGVFELDHGDIGPAWTCRRCDKLVRDLAGELGAHLERHAPDIRRYRR